jgi:hypothetical protein
MWLPSFLKSKREESDDVVGAEKKKKKRKGDGECDADDLEGNGETEFPDEYEAGGLVVKDAGRAQQLHRHDEESREILCDMDKQIERLRKLRQRATKKIRIKACPEPEGEET